MGEKYITKVARGLIGKLRIRAELFLPSPDPVVFWGFCGAQVRRELRKMRPETLGRIVVHGLPHGCEDPHEKLMARDKTSLYAVHGKNYLNSYSSGRTVLIELATTTVVAEMFDLIRRQIEPLAEDLDTFRQLQPFLLKK